jgi:ethanolamine ammonia-lyase large subunit
LGKFKNLNIKTMSKKVMQKIVSIEKQELSSEKVELAAVDDLKSLNKEYFRDTDNINSIVKGAFSEIRKAKTKIISALAVIDKMDSKISEIRKMANELGINENDIEELKDAYVAIRDSKQYQSLLSTLRKVSP